MIKELYKKYQNHLDVSENNFIHFVMWSCGAICIGFVIGLVGIAFHLDSRLWYQILPALLHCHGI